MEFLMTYGWAILVVLAAIGALAYFGILSPQRFLPSGFTMTGGFSGGQYKIDTTSVNFTVINNMGTDINLTTVNITSKAGSDVKCSAQVTPNTIVGNGDTYSFGSTNCKGTIGQKFKAGVTVTYIKSSETLSHTTTGDLTTTVESP